MSEAIKQADALRACRPLMADTIDDEQKAACQRCHNIGPRLKDVGDTGANPVGPDTSALVV